MKVMEIRDEWGLDHIKPGTRPDPRPLAGQVVVRMEAASVNYRDLVMARRGYGRRSGTLPLVPLSDGAGRVVAVGENVTRVALGDLVCPIFAQTWIDGRLREEHWQGMLGGPRDGVLQEFMLLSEEAVVKVPTHLDAMQAAALPCAALTAWNAVVVTGRTKPGDWVLVQGTGGVSLFALLFAKLSGARVMLISSSEEKIARARSLGTDEVLNYSEVPEWGRRVRDLTGGVDLVVEVAGTLGQSVKAVRPAGLLTLIGVLAGPTTELDLGPIVTQGIRLEGVTIGSRAMFEDLLHAVAQHRVVSPIEIAPHGFEEVADVLRLLSQGRHFGKICMRIAS